MSVSTHSQAQPPLYLFSTMSDKRKPEENEEAHSLLSDYFSATGIPYVELEGTWQGQKELSYLLGGGDVPEELVQAICKQGEQTCYFVLENHKHGTYKVIETDVASGAKKYIGYMRSMDKADIDRLNLDYSYRKDVDKYFTVWPTDTTMMDAFEEEKRIVGQSGIAGLRAFIATRFPGKLATV